MKDGQSFYEVVAEHRPDVFESVIHAHVEAGDVVSQRYFLDLPRLPVSLTWKASPFHSSSGSTPRSTAAPAASALGRLSPT